MRKLTAATILALAAAFLIAADEPGGAPPTLDGLYKVTSLVGRQAIDDTEFAVAKGKIEAKVLGNEPVAFTAAPPQAGAPAHIDVTTDEKSVPGIYQFSGPENEQVQIALAAGPDSARPADFSGAGPGETVLTLQRLGFLARVWKIMTTLVNPRNLSHPEKFQKALEPAGVYWAALVAVALIVFTETGLLIGFLLPGDSLLVVLGIVAQLGGWNLWPFFVCLCAAAIVGDAVGYWIGWKAGPAIFNRPSSRLFKQEYLQRAKAFYEKHGGKTIVIARFMPIVRTFVPVVAGAARMEFRTFLSYNVFGGIGWIVSMILFGYYLIPIADPPMRALLGKPDFTWAKHIDKVVVVVVVLSVLPMAWKGFKHWRDGRKTTAGEAVVAAATAVPPVEAPKVEAPAAPK